MTETRTKTLGDLARGRLDVAVRIENAFDALRVLLEEHEGIGKAMCQSASGKAANRYRSSRTLGRWLRAHLHHVGDLKWTFARGAPIFQGSLVELERHFLAHVLRDGRHEEGKA